MHSGPGSGSAKAKAKNTGFGSKTLIFSSQADVRGVPQGVQGGARLALPPDPPSPATRHPSRATTTTTAQCFRHAAGYDERVRQLFLERLRLRIRQ